MLIVRRRAISNAYGDPAASSSAPGADTAAPARVRDLRGDVELFAELRLARSARLHDVPRPLGGRQPVVAEIAALRRDVHLTVGETHQLAQEVQLAKADLQRLEDQVAAVRTTVRALEARLERREPR